MKDIVLIVIHLAVTSVKLLGRGGARAIVAENLLLKQQLIVLCRPRRRAPNLTVMDRFLFGFGTLFLSPGRICKVAIGLQPSTLLKFHEALVRRKYRWLFSVEPSGPEKPGPKGPSDTLIRCHRRAQITQSSFRMPSYRLDHQWRLSASTLTENVVRRVLLDKHYRAPPHGTEPIMAVVHRSYEG